MGRRSLKASWFPSNLVAPCFSGFSALQLNRYTAASLPTWPKCYCASGWVIHPDFLVDCCQCRRNGLPFLPGAVQFCSGHLKFWLQPFSIFAGESLIFCADELPICLVMYSKLVVLLKSPFVLNFSNSSALERYYPTQALPTPPHPTPPHRRSWGLCIYIYIIICILILTISNYIFVSTIHVYIYSIYIPTIYIL